MKVNSDLLILDVEKIDQWWKLDNWFWWYQTWLYTEGLLVRRVLWAGVRRPVSFAVTGWSRARHIKKFPLTRLPKFYIFIKLNYIWFRRKLCSNPFAWLTLLLALGFRTRQTVGYVKPCNLFSVFYAGSGIFRNTRVRFLFIDSGHMRMISSNERRLYICNVFSHWLRSFSCGLR